MTELQPSSSLASADVTEVSGNPTYFGLSLELWLQVGVLGALFIAVYWAVLRWLWDKTNPIYGEANWGHAICIPVIGLYYLYMKREELRKSQVRPTWIGMGVLLLAMLIFAYGIWPGQNQFTQGCAMVMALFGVVLLLAGWQIMKIAWFPIAYLVCGIPWPALVYSWVASPLQNLAANVAVHTLRITGVEAFQTGTKINMVGMNGQVHGLNVAEACAGLRSLMTFITVGAAIAFLSARPLWQKIIITLSAIPIAIFCNVMRVSGQGLLDHYWSRQWSEGFAHEFAGLVMLVPAFFLILLVGWILDHLFIEEAEVRTASVAVSNASRLMPAGANVAVPVQRGKAPAAPRPASAPPTPAAAPPRPAAAPVHPAAAPPRPASAPKPATPRVTPPRPGITPPRPGIVPPRPRTRHPQPPGPRSAGTEGT